MSDANVKVSGIVNRNRPTRFLDNQESPSIRLGPYSEQFTMPLGLDMANYATEGTYFTVNNGQTGIATAAAPTAFSATNPFIVIYNTEDPSNPAAETIQLDYIALLDTAAGTAGASVQCAVTIDNNFRYTSGGTELTSQIKNVNGSMNNSSVARVFAGNITSPAASSSVRTIVGNRYMKSAIPVAGDTYVLKFGGASAPHYIGISTITFSLNNVPKIILPAGWSALLHLWLPSQSAASSYAPEIGWIER